MLLGVEKTVEEKRFSRGIGSYEQYLSDKMTMPAKRFWKKWVSGWRPGGFRNRKVGFAVVSPFAPLTYKKGSCCAAV
jgi:hypothetical protein